MYTIKLWHVIHISRKKVRLEQKCIVLEHTSQAVPYFFFSARTQWLIQSQHDSLVL